MANFYAVKEGNTVGIFDTWAKCEESTKGYSGAIYKKFKDYDEAVNFIGNNNENYKMNTFYEIIHNDNLNVEEVSVLIEGLTSKDKTELIIHLLKR